MVKVDDIHIPALNLVPEHVGVSLRTDFTYDRGEPLQRGMHDVTDDAQRSILGDALTRFAPLLLLPRPMQSRSDKQHGHQCTSELGRIQTRHRGCELLG